MSASTLFERESTAGSRVQQLLGYRLVEWREDHAAIAYTVSEDHLNRSGVLHGGIIAALLDTAAGYAGTYSEGAPRNAYTLSLTTNFLLPARAGALRAVGRRTGGGRTIFFAEAVLQDGAGAVLATATGSFRYRTS